MKEITKESMRKGFILRNRQGDVLFVKDDDSRFGSMVVIIGNQLGSYIEFEDFDDNMMHMTFEQFDVMEVYEWSQSATETQDAVKFLFMLDNKDRVEAFLSKMSCLCSCSGSKMFIVNGERSRVSKQEYEEMKKNMLEELLKNIQ